MKHLKLLCVVALAALPMLCVGTNAYAQTSGSGSIFGSVVDASGQVVPGADITITNESTGEVRHAVSNEVGDYTAQALQAGPYTVRAELSGFKPYEIKNNQVLANNRLSMRPLKLEVGSLTETVSVTAVGEVVNTTVTSHQALLETKQIEDMAIRGRDPMSLLKILPGVQLLANDNETFGGSFNSPVATLQGGGGQTVYVDGVNGGDGGGGGAFSASTNMDAIEEVNVQMSAYTAEYGLKGGAQVNLVTKHGGSEYHGTGYWYKRHEMWNATNFFNNRTHTPKPLYRYSNLGGTLGGPIPKIKKINEDGKKLFFFYSIDDTQLVDVNFLKFYRVPTALERIGDFSQTVTPSGVLIPVKDPVTGANFPNNQIPANRLDPRGLAFLNLFPVENTFGVNGYNYVTQEPSIPHPRRQHLFRGDYRPTSKDSLSVKYQTFYTKSSGINVAGASARWGLVRQRYDFFVDQGNIDYTRILNTTTVLEFTSGFFSSVETGPPEDDKALAGIQRSTYPQLNRLGQFAPINNPLGLIPQAAFGNIPSADRNASNSSDGSAGGPAQIQYDGRWPITGNDVAIKTGLTLTHTRGKHTYKAGVMREDELFGQARSGTFGGSFNFAQDGNDPGTTGYAYSNAAIGHVTSYTESLGRVPDDRRQRTWAFFGQDTYKIHPKVTLDIGLRMYKWNPPVAQGGEASEFSFERFDPKWGGNPPVFYRPVLQGTTRRAQNPVTGEILPVTYVGLIVPGTGYSCSVITPSTPCQINGIVIQRDGKYLKDGGEGFVEAPPLQFDPRIGFAWALNPRTVIRLAGGSFHDGTGGVTQQQGGGNAAYRYDKVIFFTDLDNYLTGSSATSAVPNTGGIVRTDNARPNNMRFTAALERELGRNIVLNAAYVGTRTQNSTETWNYNAIKAGARFDPANRDVTVAATASNPGALPDVFLRPIPGFGDISITQTTGHSRYDSLQLQLTRRFTGGFEMQGSYTWARGYSHNLNQNNPLPSTMDRSDIQEHVLVASYTWEVPGGSKLFGKNAVAKGVLDSWRISGVSTFGTGGRGNVTATYNPSFEFSGGGETCGGYDVKGDPVLPADQRNVDMWFNTAAFVPVSGIGQVGNDCRAWKYRLPGFNNHDVTLFKDFRIKHGQLIEYRWEIYNLFNQVSFNAVNQAATFNQTTGAQTNTNFGKVTSARTERRMQMSLRYRF
jgi:hypothetical protein